MITVTVILPPNVSPDVIDFIEVSVMDDTHDRQPRHTHLEGITRGSVTTQVTFTT